MVATNNTPGECSTTSAAPSPTSRAPDPLIGRVINDRYRVISIIARGGMGRVYRAEQAALGRLVALKILTPTHMSESDPSFHKRFFLEAATSSKLSHPNTVTIFDYGRTDDDLYYIAMELLEGRTLQRALLDEGSLSPQRTMLIASEICRSLREAHSKGVIHRDLKPANVFLVRHDRRDADEAVKVLDFGLVKSVEEGSEELTKTGVFLGSPKYMAPEQIREEPTDPRADVYGLGVVMFEMLTGHAPFEGLTSVKTLMAHLSDPVRPMKQVNPKVDVPPALEELVRRCLQKSPDNRFANMNDVLRALQECANSSLSVGLSGDFQLAPSSLQEASASNGNAHAGARAESGPPTAAESSTASQAPFAQATKQGVGLAPLFLAAVFALTGVGGLVVLSRPFDVSSTPTHVTADGRGTVQTPTAVAGGQRRTPDKKVVVTLRSTPAGATVFVGEKKYGPTPVHVVWTGVEASDGRQVTFHFRLKGYRDLTLTQEVHGDRLEVDAPPMERLPPELSRRRP